MFPLYVSITLFLKVVLAFFLLYIFIPSRVTVFDEYGGEWIDKVFISIVHSNFIIIVVVHLLVAFKIYETISLAIAIIILLLYIVSIILRQPSEREGSIRNKNFLAVLLDIVDGRLGIFGNFIKSLKEFIKKLPCMIKNGLVHLFLHPFDGIFMIALLGIALYLRLRHALTYLYYGASDCYVHLAWTKYIGINKIYQDGVYPYGYEAVISALNKLFFIDPVVLIRFFGAIGSFLLVISIYYVLKKNIKNQYIVIFAAVFAFSFGTEFPNSASTLWRQLSALPQEYATAFMLPGIHFLNVFFNTGRKKYLVLSAEVLAITVFIHFYAAVFVAIGYVILSLFHIKKVFYGKNFFQLLGAMSAAGIIGILPIVTALALGKKFHALSYSYVSESATAGKGLDWRTELFRFTETDKTLQLLLLCVAAIIVFAVIRLAFKRTPEYSGRIKMFLTIAFLSLFFYTQIRAEDIGFFTIMEAYRTSTFLVVAAAALYAMTVCLIDFIPIHRLIRYIVKAAGAAVIIMTVFSMSNYNLLFPTGSKLEYDEAAYVYYKIKDEFPILNWTIVSPVEQYSQSMGYGWHYNLWEFVKDTQVEPKGKFEFPTDYLFVIVEKRPLNQASAFTLTEPVSKEDAEHPFPEVSGASDKYYTNYNNRRIIEAKAYYWMEDYIKKHDYFTVYYESDLIKVYLLRQDGTKPINLNEKTEEEI